MTVDPYSLEYNRHVKYARTGAIKCDGGFSVRFKLNKEYNSNWFGVEIFLIANQIPFDQLKDKFNSIDGKEDPSTWIYGVKIDYTKATFNLKRNFTN